MLTRYPTCRTTTIALENIWHYFHLKECLLCVKYDQPTDERWNFGWKTETRNCTILFKFFIIFASPFWYFDTIIYFLQYIEVQVMTCTFVYQVLCGAWCNTTQLPSWFLQYKDLDRNKKKPIVSLTFFLLKTDSFSWFFLYTNMNVETIGWEIDHTMHTFLFPTMCCLVLHTCTYSRTYLFANLATLNDKKRKWNFSRLIDSFRFHSVTIVNALWWKYYLIMRRTVLSNTNGHTWSHVTSGRTYHYYDVDITYSITYCTKVLFL